MRNRATPGPIRTLAPRDDVVTTVTAFVAGMVARMTVSFHRYGLVGDAYPHKVSALASLIQRVELYRDTLNIETMADAANFAMIEYMCPSIGDGEICIDVTQPGSHKFDYWVCHQVFMPTNFQPVTPVTLNVLCPSSEYSAEFLRAVAERHSTGPTGLAAGLAALDAYRATGDRGHLVDVAVSFLGEFIEPSYDGTFFAGTDSDASPGRVTVDGTVTAVGNTSIAA